MTGAPPITLVGAGLAGPLMAAYLGQAGYRVHLYEKRADPRVEGSEGGRSINLALSLRGIHALEEVGVLDQVREISIPMRGRMMHAVSGKLTFQPYGTEDDQYLLSVSRGKLNELLLTAAEEHPGVTVHFEHDCRWVSRDLDHAVFETPSGKRVEAETPVLIGADGAFSRVRAAMQHGDRFDYSQDYLEHGYKELSLPPTADGEFALEPEALHIWPRRTYMMIALPNLDRTLTCTLFWPFEGPNSFDSIRTEKEILDFFHRTFPDAVPLIPDLVGQFQENVVGSLVTVRCRPWQREGKAVLVGDACHAVVPFYGQGMNAAFEDCTVLNRCLKEHAPDLGRAFMEYESLRKDNVDVLADLALANFVEMRDHVGSRSFLIRKSAERWLHRLFPRWFLPLYTMVTFTRMPYAEAKARSDRQNRTVQLLAVLVLAAVLTGLGLWIDRLLCGRM